MNKVSASTYVASSGWFVLVVLLLIAMFTSSCATGGYCKSWNNPAGAAPVTSLSDQG